MAAAPDDVPAEVACAGGPRGEACGWSRPASPPCSTPGRWPTWPSSSAGAREAAPGPRERDEAVARLGPELVAHLRARARAGLTVTAVAESRTEGALAAGSYQPVGAVAEIVGVGTLPAARRRGLAGAVTAALAGHARQCGVRALVLSAENDDVGRIYRRAGFRRIGTTHAA